MLTFELFGELTALAGRETLSLAPECPPTSVKEALELLAREQPALTRWLDHCAVACGDRILLRTDPIPGDQALALLPPVTGG